MLEQASSFGMSAVGLTDHGNLFGAIKFYRKALKKGIRPVIGIEAYMAPGDRRERHLAPGQKKPYYHLILLAENYTGYKNLIRLVSQGYREGFYYKPRIDTDDPRRAPRGIIALSACLGGEIATLLRQDRVSRRGARRARATPRCMGDGNYFLEIQDQGLPEEAGAQSQARRALAQDGTSAGRDERLPLPRARATTARTRSSSASRPARR